MKYLQSFNDFLLEGEIEILDKEIRNKVSEFYNLQQEIKKLEAEIEEKKAAFKQFESDIKPMLDGMKETGDKLATTEDYVIKITRFGFERSDVSYKNAFENALTKVNAATKKVLNEALAASRSVTQIKHSFKIEKIANEENIFIRIKNAISIVSKKLMDIFRKEIKNIDQGNKELKKLI